MKPGVSVGEWCEPSRGPRSLGTNVRRPSVRPAILNHRSRGRNSAALISVSANQVPRSTSLARPRDSVGTKPGAYARLVLLACQRPRIHAFAATRLSNGRPSFVGVWSRETHAGFRDDVLQHGSQTERAQIRAESFLWRGKKANGRIAFKRTIVSSSEQPESLTRPTNFPATHPRQRTVKRRVSGVGLVQRRA